MTSTNPEASPAVTYNTVAQLLHWLVVGMLAVQFLLAELAEEAAHRDAALEQLALLANHKSIGITLLLLALVRVVWRFIYAPPALPKSIAAWQQRAAQAMHVALYVLLFLLPISGWLMSSASAYTVSWFNLVQLPDFVSPSEDLKTILGEVHEVLASALVVLVALHVLSGLKHVVVDRDGVMSRMWSWPLVVLAVFVSLIVGYLVGPVALQSAEPAKTALQQSATVPLEVSGELSGDVSEFRPGQTSQSDIAAWSIDYTDSMVSFTAEQAGARFTGVWPSWQADIRLDPADLSHSSALVYIDTTEVSTEDDDRDTTLLGPDFFDVAHFPIATFHADTFQAATSGYVAKGVLTLKDLSFPIEFHFQLSDFAQDQVRLEGTARLDRLTFGIGKGDWQSTQWVGQYVDVHVHVTAQVQN